MVARGKIVGQRFDKLKVKVIEVEEELACSRKPSPMTYRVENPQS